MTTALADDDDDGLIRPPGITADEAADALAEAVDREDDARWPIVDARADWDDDGTYTHTLSDLTTQRFALTEVTITRELSSDLPAEVGLVDGQAAASCELTLAAEWDPDTGEVEDGTDPVRAFAPYDPDAPLYGTSPVGAGLEVDLGFDTTVGEVLAPRFRGTVASVTPDPRPDQRTVKVTGVDGANRMRAPIFQPPMAMDSLLLARYGPARYSSRINSQWLVDRIARANGIYASPPPQPGSFISATMHGSAIPEIGFGGMPQQASYATPSAPKPWSNAGHPHGMLYPAAGAPAQAGTWSAAQELTMLPGDGFGCSFLLRCPTRPVSPYLMGANLGGGDFNFDGLMYAVLVTLSAGAPAMIVYTPDGGASGVTLGDWSLPKTPTWRHIGMHWSFTTGTCHMQIAVDGVPLVPYLAPIDLTRSPTLAHKWAPTTTIEYELGASVTNVCWWRSPRPPETWSGVGWQSQADIDPGLNELTGIPEIAGEESWPLLQEIAAAESAQVGFSAATNRFYFRSRAVPRPFGTPTRLTADRELADMVTTTDEAAVRNSITAATTPIYTGDYEVVVEATSATQFECGAGSTRFTVPLPAGTTVVDPPYVAQLNAPGYLDSWSEVKDRADWRSVLMYCAVYSAAPELPVDPNLVNIRLFQETVGEIIFVVFNYASNVIRFQVEDKLSDPDPTTGEVTRTKGEPAFRLPGRLVKDAATTPQNITDPGSVAKFGYRTFELGGSGGSRWHHFPAATRGVGEAILPSTAHPIPLLDAVTVLHDPRRDLNAAVTLVAPDGLGEVTGTVAGKTERRAVGEPATDRLTVRPRVAPGFGILGESGIGTTLRFGA